MTDITPEAARAQAEAALVEGDLAAEVGVPVSWREVRALHDVIRALLSVFPEPPTTDDRETLIQTLGQDANYTERGVFHRGRAADAVLAAGFRRPSPPTDEQIDAAARAMYRHTGMLSVSGARDLFQIGLTAAWGCGMSERIGDSVREPWDVALADLQRLASERPESVTEHVETLNRFLLAGGDLQQLRVMTWVLTSGPTPDHTIYDQEENRQQIARDAGQSTSRQGRSSGERRGRQDVP